jgi:hypothetical protein
LADKPQQQQTLSVRISEALRQRLERARQLLASKTGETVSTSEIAKQLLESAREDRLEVVDLLSEPTKALLEIRRKGEAGHLLSKAEWTVLAYFVQQGLEAFASERPNPVSMESLVAVLDAFLAGYELRKGGANRRDEYYLGNLPEDCQPSSKGKDSEAKEKAAPEVVRKTVAEARRRKAEPTSRYLFAGRNLYVLIDEETFSGTDSLNRALRPYWPGLWRLAARGHYYLKQEPIRPKPKISEDVYKPPIPPVSEGGFTLSFTRGEGNDFAMLLSFPGPRTPQYPISRYPVIAEFRAMLAALDPDGPTDHWKGEYFFAYRSEEGREAEFSFRARDNGITFTFSAKDWNAIRGLFRRAWENPDLRLAWDGLLLEYGEL